MPNFAEPFCPPATYRTLNLQSPSANQSARSQPNSLLCLSDNVRSASMRRSRPQSSKPRAGDQSWHRVRVAATDCPRISQAFLEEELRELGAQRFSEEYGLEFLDPDTAVFLTAIIDAAFSNDVRPLWQ
jgi:hypothetical protein